MRGGASQGRCAGKVNSSESVSFRGPMNSRAAALVLRVHREGAGLCPSPPQPCRYCVCVFDMHFSNFFPFSLQLVKVKTLIPAREDQSVFRNTPDNLRRTCAAHAPNVSGLLPFKGLSFRLSWQELTGFCINHRSSAHRRALVFSLHSCALIMQIGTNKPGDFI